MCTLAGTGTLVCAALSELDAIPASTGRSVGPSSCARRRRRQRLSCRMGIHRHASQPQSTRCDWPEEGNAPIRSKTSLTPSPDFALASINSRPSSAAYFSAISRDTRRASGLASTMSSLLPQRRMSRDGSACRRSDWIHDLAFCEERRRAHVKCQLAAFYL